MSLTLLLSSLNYYVIMNRVELEEMEAHEFYDLPETKIVSMIHSADDDVEKVLIIKHIFDSTAVNAKEWLWNIK